MPTFVSSALGAQLVLHLKRFHDAMLCKKGALLKRQMNDALTLDERNPRRPELGAVMSLESKRGECMG
jgi:hypothetical protein